MPSTQWLGYRFLFHFLLFLSLSAPRSLGDSIYLPFVLRVQVDRYWFSLSAIDSHNYPQ